LFAETGTLKTGVVNPGYSLLQFQQFYVPASSTTFLMTFTNLVRGLSYNMKCLGKNNAATAASTSTSFIMPMNTTNSNPTMCVQFGFSAQYNNDTSTGLLRYCQATFSSSGQNANGCVMCVIYGNSMILANVSGLYMPNDTVCPQNATNGRLRFLKEKEKEKEKAQKMNQERVLQNGTYTPYFLSMCAVSNPVCKTDVSKPSTLSSTFTTFISSLTATNFNQLTGAVTQNIPFNASATSAVITDSVINLSTELTITNYTNIITGELGLTANSSIPLQLYFKLVTGSVATDTCAAIMACAVSNTQLCGNGTITQIGNSIASTVQTTLANNTAYTFEYCATQNMPNAQQTSNVSAIQFTTVNLPWNNTANSSSNWISCSFALLGLLFLFI